jgi:hypothetical protein
MSWRLFTTSALLLWAAVAVSEPVAATYELRASSGGEERSAEFVLVRTDQVVEVQDKASSTVERWERDPSGKIFYSRIFLDARKVIEFQPADFASAGVTDNWEAIREILPIASLQALTARGHGRTLGVRTDLYRGNVDGAKVSVAWIADVGLPAQVERKGATAPSRLQLTSLERGDAASASLVSNDQLDSFERIDFADLGDREGDPVIEGLLAQSGLALHSH